METLITDAEDLVPDVRKLLIDSAVTATTALLRKAELGDAVFNSKLFNVLRMPTGPETPQ